MEYLDVIKEIWSDENNRFPQTEYYKTWSPVTIPLNKITTAMYFERNAWCKEHVSIGKYYINGATYWFEFEEDAILFALKFVG